MAGSDKAASKVGQILLHQGAITEDQLEVALGEQRRIGGRLGAILTDLGVVSEEAVSRALAQQGGVDHVDPLRERPANDVLALVPRKLALECDAVPLRVEEHALVLAMANPTDIVAIDRVQRAAGLFVRAVSAPRGQVLRAIEAFYAGGSDEALESAISDAARAVSSDSPGDASAVALVGSMLAAAAADDATDVHLEPDEKVLRVRQRVDGALRLAATLPRALMPSVIARIKIMSGLDITESRLPQDGKIRWEEHGRRIDVRVSTFPTVLGESVVLRILDPSRAQRSLESLGVTREQAEALHRAASRPNGLILVTGPTGAGKTTTLYALLRAVSTSDRKTITLEDPVEYQLPLVTQCQVSERAGLSFASGLRAVLRHDPDVILVGEMRDAETAAIAVRAALTGHLVLSTLHTNDAVSSLVRLNDLGTPSYLVGSCLVLVVAQRLVRLLCSECRQPFEPSEGDRTTLSLENDAVLYRSKGCERCHDTGSRGRRAVFEVLEITPAVARRIAAGASHQEIVAAAREAGFDSLREAARRLALAGEISPEEVVRVTVGG